MMTALDTLIVVRDQASALIRDEVRAGNQRAALENAVYDAVNKLGCNVNDVSEASGLTLTEVRRIASKPRELNLDQISGSV